MQDGGGRGGEIEVDLRLAGDETLRVQLRPQPALSPGPAASSAGSPALPSPVNTDALRLEVDCHGDIGSLCRGAIELQRDSLSTAPTRTPRNVTGAPTDKPLIEPWKITTARVTSD